MPTRGADLQIPKGDEEGLTIELLPGENTYDIFRYRLTDESKSAWKRTNPALKIIPGRYQLSATLVVDQQHSDWKGTLHSDQLQAQLHHHQ